MVTAHSQEPVWQTLHVNDVRCLLNDGRSLQCQTKCFVFRHFQDREVYNYFFLSLISSTSSIYCFYSGELSDPKLSCPSFHPCAGEMWLDLKLLIQFTLSAVTGGVNLHLYLLLCLSFVHFVQMSYLASGRPREEFHFVEPEELISILGEKKFLNINHCDSLCSRSSGLHQCLKYSAKELDQSTII